MTYFDSGDTDSFVVDSRALLKALLNPDAAADDIDEAQVVPQLPPIRQPHEKKPRPRFWRGSSARETGTRCATVRSTIHARHANH
jgi:hypothetical protein